MSKLLTFTVPLVPPTVNHYVKHTRNGRHYVTAEARSFKDAVGIFARGEQLNGKAYSVSFIVYLKAGQKGDVDNFAKVVLDGLVSAGVIDTDAKVKTLTITKERDVENPRTEITVGVIQ
jgi:crossover junction endodeoxyribonuclease RusA